MYFTLQPVKMPQSTEQETWDNRRCDPGNFTEVNCIERFHRANGSLDGADTADTPLCSLQRPPAATTRFKMHVCAGCNGPIEDRYYLLAADQQWHNECLRCCECKVTLDNELTCFYKDGGIYCKEHYFRRYGVRKCSRCFTGILANDMVMRARDCVYHLACFTCTLCGTALAPGDYFGMRDTHVYCRTHYEMGGSPGQHPHHHALLHGDTAAPYPSTQQQHQGLASNYQGPLTPGPSPPCSTGHVAFYNGMGVSVHKGRPRKRKGADSVGDYCRGLDGHLGLEGDGYVSQQSQRTKRMRTSFKHHQLRTMKSYFGLNHNPDAKDLKQLAQKTGLTKRVLQVWFQNARAKYRRSLLKKEQGGDGLVGSSPSGDLNSMSSPSTNGRSSPISTTGCDGGTSRHIGGFCASSGSEQDSMLGSPGDVDEDEDEIEDDGASFTSEGLSYSELKNACGSDFSPAVADEVLTISAMPAHSPNNTLAGDCLPSPNALNGSILRTNLVDIFN